MESEARARAKEQAEKLRMEAKATKKAALKSDKPEPKSQGPSKSTATKKGKVAKKA